MSSALSVIICTRNRADSLRACLATISADEMRQASGEVILVDNGSTDETLCVMAEFQAAAPFPVIVCREATAGQGRARNTGVLHATADVLFFTDDDCYLVPRTILRARAIFDSRPFRYCGGQLLLYDAADANYGCRSFDTLRLIPPRTMIPAGMIYGACMAIHRSVFDAVEGFDPEFGPGTPFAGDDVDFCARASMAGFVGAVTPELAVYHHHRRRHGPDLIRLMQRDDIARGAYYAKFILNGYPSYLRVWRYTAFHDFPPERTLREIKGALQYAARRFVRNGTAARRTSPSRAVWPEGAPSPAADQSRPANPA